jgi:hypothetical protein
MSARYGSVGWRSGEQWRPAPRATCVPIGQPARLRSSFTLLEAQPRLLGLSSRRHGSGTSPTPTSRGGPSRSCCRGSSRGTSCSVVENPMLTAASTSTARTTAGGTSIRRSPIPRCAPSGRARRGRPPCQQGQRRVILPLDLELEVGRKENDRVDVVGLQLGSYEAPVDQQTPSCDLPAARRFRRHPSGRRGILARTRSLDGNCNTERNCRLRGESPRQGGPRWHGARKPEMEPFASTGSAPSCCSRSWAAHPRPSWTQRRPAACGRRTVRDAWTRRFPDAPTFFAPTSARGTAPAQLARRWVTSRSRALMIPQRTLSSNPRSPTKHGSPRTTKLQRGLGGGPR